MSKLVVIVILLIIILLGGYILAKPMTASTRQAIADCYTKSNVISTVRTETSNTSIEQCSKSHDAIQAFNTCMNQVKSDYGDLKTTISMTVSPLNKEFSVDTIRDNHNKACSSYPEMKVI